MVLLALQFHSCAGQTTTVINLPPNPVVAAILQPATVVAGGTNAFGSSNSPLSQLQDGTANVALPYDCTQPVNACSWNSSNSAVATVSQMGLATGVGGGTSTITYTSTKAGYPVVGSAVLTVSAAPLFTAPIPPCSPCALPPGTNGVAYSFTFAATGGVTPYTFSITSGSFSACGVTLTGATGVLAGTPTTGSCTAAVKVTDSASNTTSISVSLTINSTSMCGPPNYSCSSNSTAVIQTPTPPFSTPSSNGKNCVAGTANGSGNGCYNSIGYDTSINPFGVDPILRVSDGTMLDGKAVSLTFSGGDGDQTFGCTGTSNSSDCSGASLYYLGSINDGGPTFTGIEIVSGLPTVVAPFPASQVGQVSPPLGAIAASGQNHAAFFMEAPNSSCSGCSGDPTIFKLTMDGGTGHVPIVTETTFYDAGASCSVLPNGITFGQLINGQFGHDINDNIFGFDISVVKPLAAGVDTAAVTNGSNAFTLSGPTALLTNGSDVYAQIKFNGGATYTIATIAAGGMSGTLTTNYAGATGSGLSVAVIGGQGSGIYLVMVQISPAACQVINTYTGASLGAGAWASTATGTLSTCTGMRVHDTTINDDGTYLATAGASTGIGCGVGEIFQQIGTLTAVACTGTIVGGGNLCGGHDTFGFHNHQTISNPELFEFAPQNASSATPFSSYGSVPPGFPANCENHFSWRNATSGDTQPIIVESAQNNFSTSGTTSTWGYPTMNEVLALSSSGGIRRFFHNFILGPGNAAGCGTTNIGPFDSNSLFETQDGIGNVSQDGRLWAFPSSMLGQLGIDAKGLTRTDLFVGLLQ
jgi:Bacterial Ig-like domain (group 2)